LEIEDAATVVLRSSETNAIGVLNAGWFSSLLFPKLDFRVIVHGTEGYMSSDDLWPRNIYLHALKEACINTGRKLIGKPIRRLSYTYFYASHVDATQDFYEAVINDTEPPVTLKSQYDVIRIIQEAYNYSRSAKVPEAIILERGLQIEP
jgi:predicted dehydrogenase